MSKGLLGKVIVNAAAAVKAYEVPTNIEFATVSINVLNTNAGPATIKVSIGTAATPTLGDYIHYNTVLEADGGILDRTYMLLSTNEKIIVDSDVAGVIVRVYGLESPI